MRLSAFAFTLAAVLFSSSASADPTCWEGSRSSGPNCVSSQVRPPTEFSANASAITVSWVYRLVNGLPVTVWKGIGEVIASTPKKLRIRVSFTPKPLDDGKARTPITYEYDLLFDGKAYAVRGF